MALAGSNGGSWSTTYSLKPNAKLGSESCMPSGEVETGAASNNALLREYHGRLSVPGNSSPAAGFADRILTPAGNLLTPLCLQGYPVGCLTPRDQ